MRKEKKVDGKKEEAEILGKRREPERRETRLMGTKKSKPCDVQGRRGDRRGLKYR